jgi:uncharacterized protein YeaO (DUF488 family)
MAKLYTTYLSKLKKLSFNDNCNIYFIARYKPASAKITHFPDVAPSPVLLGSWKLGQISWEEFEKEYYKELSLNENQANVRLIAQNILDLGQDVCIVCYEKDIKHCHRRLLAEYIKDEYKIDWEEL